MSKQREKEKKRRPTWSQFSLKIFQNSQNFQKETLKRIHNFLREKEDREGVQHHKMKKGGKKPGFSDGKLKTAWDFS